MLKKLSILILSMILIASCSGDSTHDEATKDQPTTDQVASLTIAEFNADGETYEGKLVEILGTVDHVCAHSGKRMFIIGEDPADRVKIEAGDVGSFDISLQGSKVKVMAVGTVMKIDSAYLDNWASEVKGDEPAEGCSEEQKEMAKGDEEHESAMDQINSLRLKLAEAEKDYLAFCSLEAKSFEEVK